MQTLTFLPSVSPCISSSSSISCCDEMIRFHFAIFSSVTQIPPFIYHSGRLSKLCRNFPTVSSQPQIALKVATRASNIRANPAPTKVPRVRKANRLLFEDPDCLWVLVSPLGSANTQEVACFVCFCTFASLGDQWLQPCLAHDRYSVNNYSMNDSTGTHSPWWSGENTGENHKALIAHGEVLLLLALADPVGVTWES